MEAVYAEYRLFRVVWLFDQLRRQYLHFFILCTAQIYDYTVSGWKRNWFFSMMAQETNLWDFRWRVDAMSNGPILANVVLQG